MSSRESNPLLDDFRAFLWAMWEHLRLPAPTPIQYDIAKYLQHGPRRRMVQAFRGVGKSWITAAYVLWCLLRNANERCLVVSASKERADAFSTFVKRMIAEWDVLESLKPEEGMRDSNVAFDVGGSMPHQSPSVRSVGITGQMTGGRASKIIPDDIETPKNSMTQTMRDRLGELVKEFDAILMSEEDLKSLGIASADIVYLGTPQTEMSLYNQLPERGYDVRVWPARFPQKVDQYRDRLAPMLAQALATEPRLITACSGRGAPTDPKRFHDLDLMEREASYGRSGFSLQFMLDTTLSDADRYPLKLADLMVMGLNVEVAPVRVVWGSGPDQIRNDLPAVGLTGDRWHRPMWMHQEFIDYAGCMMAIDPSGRGSDETGYAVVAMRNGFLYVLEAGGLKGGYDDATLNALAQIAKRNKVKWIRIEPNFGDGMFDKLFAPVLQRVYPCTIDPDAPRSSIQKEKRIIDILEPVMNQHRLVFDEKIVRDDLKVEDTKYQLFYQLTRITRDKGALAKDDRIDALAQAVGYWTSVLDKDTLSIDQAHKDEALRKELENWGQHVVGNLISGTTGPPKGPNWMQSNAAFQ